MYMLTEGFVRKRAIFESAFCGTNTISPGRRCASSCSLFLFNIFFRFSTRASTKSLLIRRNSTT